MLIRLVGASGYTTPFTKQVLSLDDAEPTEGQFPRGKKAFTHR